MSEEMTAAAGAAAARGGSPYFAIIVVIALGAVIGAGVAFKNAGDLKKENTDLRVKLRAYEGKTIAPSVAMVPASRLKERETEIERLGKELQDVKRTGSQQDQDKVAVVEKLNGLERQIERLETDLLGRDRQIEELDSQLRRARERLEAATEKPPGGGGKEGEMAPAPGPPGEKPPEAPKEGAEKPDGKGGEPPGGGEGGGHDGGTS